MNKLEEHYFMKLAEDNEFYRSLYYQYKDNGKLSEKQMSFVEKAIRPMVEASQKSEKLDKWS